MTLGLIGVGIVGGSLRRWFLKNTNHTLKIYDPEKGHEDDVSDCDACFISVPVPTNQDGSQDVSILEEVLGLSQKVTFIRSTVVPGTNDYYGTYSLPEFLTERIAFDDMNRMGILCGLQDQELMKAIFPDKKIHYMSNIECELAKYAHNSFGAMKVNFFNLIHEICQREKCDYNKVLEGVLMSGYINKTHTQVPGPDGQFGFGGACFPKDLKAFNYKYPTLSLSACLMENKTFRNKPIANQ